ncbi:MAG: hypothetical protein AAF633_04865 [Chloroflexota bacterium]
MVQNVAGDYHFNGTFRNVKDVARILAEYEQDPTLNPLVESERTVIFDLFEITFNHASFTGRSGTFFAYEGLGSIYWHMVSKLLLAVQECYLAAIANGDDEAQALAKAYYDVRAGIGFNKSPEPSRIYLPTSTKREKQKPLSSRPGRWRILSARPPSITAAAVIQASPFISPTAAVSRWSITLSTPQSASASSSGTL